MAVQSVDSEVLSALFVMSRNTSDGVNYLDFVKQGIMNGALDLLDGGYAERVSFGKDDANYRLTSKGLEYVSKVVDFASDIF